MKLQQAILRSALLLFSTLLAAPLLAQTPTDGASVPVTVQNFTRAESDLYFSRIAKLGGFGQLYHFRAPTPIDKQTVVAMNRDTLYSGGVFDLDAGPVTITLPENDGRFMSLLVISEDHYTPLSGYAPGSFTLDKAMVGTRYAMLVVRTLANANDPEDIAAANTLQDRIVISQASKGQFEVPAWDPVSQGKIRDALVTLRNHEANSLDARAGTRGEVDPVLHLIATASGWGLNPLRDAYYTTHTPQQNDGKTVSRLTVKDVPVDGFWSISVYNANRYFEQNALDSYSINNLTATPNADGSFTVQFGGCSAETANCLVTPPDWNYLVRLYRPQQAILDGSWVFPEPVAVKP